MDIEAAIAKTRRDHLIMLFSGFATGFVLCAIALKLIGFELG